MPRFQHGPIQLHYEIEGEGPPILLLCGLGWGAWSWYRQRPVLAREFRVIALENRGVGESDAPPGPCTIEQMADDARALLDHLDIARASIVGVSMGGFIAQEIALQHPSRVVALVLCNTAFGGPRALAPSREVITALKREAAEGWSASAIRARMGLRLSREFIEANPALVDELVEQRRACGTAPHAWAAQLEAALSFASETRLPRLNAPTLVLTGDQDAIVPSENSHALARRIAGARLAVLPGGHFCFLESAEAFNDQVLRFLREAGRAA